MNYRESEYWTIWQEVCRLHQKYVYSCNGIDWNEVTDEALKLAKKYKNKPEEEFVKDLILSIINDLERTNPISNK